jgi:hypothetical protein
MNEMHAHKGPHFDRWRQRMAAAIGVTLPDDHDESETDNAA